MKKITKGNQKMIEGINLLADTVKVTLGPQGECVAIQGFQDIPEITRDGATVAKSITFDDPELNMGAQLVCEAAVKTEEQAGDGTSGTTVLIQELVKQLEIMKKDQPTINLNLVRAGMEKAVGLVTNYIKANSVTVGSDLEKIRRVATISANNDPVIGDLIIDCMKKVGHEGVITSDLATGLETTIDVVEGMKIDRGWLSPLFINSETDGTCSLDQPLIAVIGERIGTVRAIEKLLNTIAESQRPLLLVCDDIDDSVVRLILINVQRGAIKCCVVKGVDFGDSRKNIMQDLATMCGAKHFTPELGCPIESYKDISELGNAGKVVVHKDSFIVYQAAGDKEDIKARLDIIKDRLADPKTSSYDKTKLQTRLAALSGGIGVIKAGGASESERINKRATIDDAILAAKSAIEEGISTGGGVTLLGAALNGSKSNFDSLETEELQGMAVVFKSLRSISRTIMTNSGMGESEASRKIEEIIQFNEGSEGAWKYGYNAKTSVTGDLVEMGVVDSTKVLRVSIENAVAAAGLCMLTAYTVTNKPENKGCGCCEM